MYPVRYTYRTLLRS